MNPRFLLDTHILVRWLAEPERLSREQRRTIDDIAARSGRLGVSAITLIELAVASRGQKWLANRFEGLLEQVRTNPEIELLPITPDVAAEVAAMGDYLRDPGDRVIVATARVHGLRLITADQRIIDSHLVSVIE